MAKISLSAPWIIHYRKIEAMFKYDSEMSVIFDEEKNILTLYVDDGAKADALRQLLPVEKSFGNIKMVIDIIPANPVQNQKVTSKDPASIFEEAFSGNPAFSFTAIASGIYSSPLVYVVFIKEVVQYWTDDLGDYNGIASTLYQDIAKEIFEECGFENVFYCTEISDPPIGLLGEPLGEWP